MNAKKLKIRVKTSKFSIPIPALRISTYRWITKQILRYYPSHAKTSSPPSGEKEVMGNILDKITYQDVDNIFNQLEQTEPFKIVDVKADDVKEGLVRVEIYTV